MILIIFFMFSVYGSFSEGRNVSVEYILHPQIKRQTCTSTNAIGTNLAQSFFVCAYQCFQHTGCVSFFYSNTTMMCYRCNTTYDVMNDVLSDEEGRSMYYSAKAGDIGGDTTVTEDTTVAQDSTTVEDQRFRLEACYSINCNAKGEAKYRCEAVLEALNMEAITVDKCYEFCSENYADYFSISMSDCYCDMSYYDFGTCSTPCAGNQHQMCGGPKSVSFYEIKQRN